MRLEIFPLRIVLEKILEAGVFRVQTVCRVEIVCRVIVFVDGYIGG